MAKKITLLTVDIESTMTEKAADVAFVLQDIKGNVLSKCAVLVRGIYDAPDYHCLFHNEKSGDLWKFDRLNDRYANYQNMLENGNRMLASVSAINNWLMTVKSQYNPVLTAYNLSFDLGKCANTGINLEPFDKRFCLWGACIATFAKTRKYRRFIVENHFFTNRTIHGNMSYKTSADIMSKFLANNPELPSEPHTSLEDILGYEKPLLDKILEKRSVKWLLENRVSYNWRNFQVKDWFTVK